MVTASIINRLSQEIDQIEKRLQQNRPLKVVQVRCGREEDRMQRLNQAPSIRYTLARPILRRLAISEAPMP
jgi:hypothetical protein